ncbi:S8 family serine peptidase [Uliginosibacterium gangwonense]|uniref:S8 family serine peptidase n=1 Tax=Uliginosibacterium gangwonense TaxID=392736 RepID=UPI000364175E|nr:S8 family serine peptidase [Uliginosibacterium gangwonense]
MKFAFARNSTGLLTLLLALAACSGGGGSAGGGGGSGTPRYTISGTVILPDTAAVDSDTNDPAQVGWAGNDTNATAQSLNTPVQLVGYLNQPGKGAAGKTYAAGDLQDIFKVSLVAGQVIELSFASNTTDNDIDLLLFDVSSASAVPVGVSSSSTSRECIAVTKDGSYYVMPWIVKGAAVYSLHISAANDGTSCANGMSNTALFVPGELVAQERVKSVAQSGSLATPAMQATAHIPKLLSVPNGATQLSLAGHATPVSVDQRDVEIQQVVGTLRYAKELMASGNYAYVEPNFRTERFSSYAPNDPKYSYQLWNYGQINVPDAMDRIKAFGITGQRPIIAVIDNGVFSEHPDLQDQIVSPYTFTALTTAPGADDPRTANECNSGVALDSCGHGTFVAGVAAAIANNGVYGTGVAPMALLMPIREDDSEYNQIQAIRYAAGLSNSSGTLPDRKADVINISWGSGAACSAGFADAIAAARAQNVVVVAAAGNTKAGKQTPPIVASPASCPGVISVGATNASTTRTLYSAFGPALTLTAPGGDASSYIYSTASAFSSRTTPADKADFYYNYGTSFSAPHVAGVIALMRYVSPGITTEQIDTLIATGRLTDDLGVAGRDDEYGQGLINARKSVDEAYALATGGSIPGAVVPLPASISFGSVLSSTTLKVKLTASGSETVSSIVASSPAITITATASVDAATKLGDYTISVNRLLLPLGYSYPTLTVTTSTRTFTVPLSVTKLSVSTSPSATLGTVWVRATNLETTTTYMQRLDVSGGRYSWNLSGMRGGTYVLNASTDLNNDGMFCNAGEACGDYPGNGQTFQIGSNLTGLDFSMAPTLNTASTP